MKHVNQFRHSPTHGSPLHCQLPGLIWFCGHDEKLSSDENWALLATSSYEEIAGVLEYPVGTVRSRLYRGQEELKEILRPYFVEA